MFVTQTIVPVALAPLLFGEHFDRYPARRDPARASLALLIAGAAMLARSPLLLALMEGERDQLSSGSAANPSHHSQDTTRSSPSTEEGEPSTATTTTSPARAGR